MSLSALMSSQAPYLRRYARALSGSQSSGDAYVVALLEALIESSTLCDRSLDDRVAVFKAFSKIWNSVPVNAIADERMEACLFERRLENITPLPRQAFLLTALENFTHEEAAEVLDIPASRFSELVAEAGRAISAQIASSVLVIEDEQLIARDLEVLVEDLGHRVIGNARTHAEAVAIAGSSPPGLVLADVRLADGSSGIDAVKEILSRFNVPVIFVTAFPESLLTAERPEPTFLITKPFKVDMVRAVISQALFFGADRQTAPVAA